MSKKVLIGMFAFFVGLALASAGYQFGKHLAKQQTPDSGQARGVA